jgi:hypothetical protein
MTSIGRLLVVISMGPPHARQVTIIGEEAAAWTGSDGLGGASGTVGDGARRRNMLDRFAKVPCRQRMSVRRSIHNSRRIASHGTSPSVAYHAEKPRIDTTSTTKAPVFASWTWKRELPSSMPCGTTYVNWPVAADVAVLRVGPPTRPYVRTKVFGRMLEADLPVIEYRIVIVSPGAYEARSNSTLRKKPISSVTVIVPWTVLPACVAVTMKS